MAMATETREWGLWINGEWSNTTGNDAFDVTNPATGEQLATVQQAGTADLDRAVAAAQTALPGWAKTPAAERSRLLHALADLIQAHRGELAELEMRNVGKAISSVKAELFGAINTFRFFASSIGAQGGESLPVSGSIMSYTRKDPVGVVGQIIPWNYPLMMASWKLAPALAAGCTIVMKPATATPLTALRLAELSAEAGIPEGVVNVLPGHGAQLGNALVEHPGIAKIAFTGATSTGKEIMARASQTMKRLTLELGGKSPNIVFSDADFSSAIPSSVWSIYYSAGQSCEARSRILVEASAFDEFVEGFVDAVGRLKVGDPSDKETHIGSLISSSHRDKVQGFVERAVGEGATLAAGGSAPDVAGLAGGAFFSPTVLTDVRQGMEVAQQEVFGPVVTIQRFTDEKEAIQLANDVRYGLMATVWTGNPERGHRVASRVQSGMVGVNVPYTAMPGLPFGGHKESGFGRELSASSLDHYLEEKAVLFGTGSRNIDPWGLGV